MRKAWRPDCSREPGALVKIYAPLVLLSLASFTLSIGAAELLVRAFFPPADFEGDRQLARRFHPHQRFHQHSPHGEFDLRHRYNSQGMHDREHERKKAPGVRRVLVIGDSFVEAAHVRLEETFASRLEARLASRTPTEVINAGRSGFGCAEEYLVLRHFGIEREPDLVVQAFFVNDLWDDDASASEIEWDEAGIPIRMRGRRSELLRLLHDRLLRIGWRKTPHADMPALLRGVVRDQFMTEPYWQRSLRMLEAADALAREHGAAYMLVLVPVQEQVETLRARRSGGPDPDIWITDALQRRLVAWGDAQGILVLDLLDAFIAYPVDETYYVMDGHWNPRGHELAATAIADVVEQQPWFASWLRGSTPGPTAQRR